MPGGLPEVVQAVGADATKYISEYRAARAETQGLIKDNRELLGLVAQVQGALSGGTGSSSGASDIARTNAAIRESLAAMREYRSAIGDTAAATSAAAAGYETMRASVGEVSDAVSSHTGALTEFTRVQQSATEAVSGHADAMDDELAAIRAAQAAAADFAAASREHATSYQYADTALAAFLGDQTVALDRTSALADAVKQAGRDARGYATDLGSVRNTARDTSSALSDVATAAAAVRDSAPSGGGGGLGDDLRGIGQTLDRQATDAGFASYRDMISASSLGWGGGGGGSSGGGGGGSGGGGGGVSGFFGGAFGGLNVAEHRADTTWDAVAGGIATWYPRIHMAMMATNEILATVGPAVIAGATAAAVGAQGGQTLYGRLTAVNAVSQSLGPSLGQTSGSFLGIGSGLQKAQNQADASVWELFGAGLNSVKAATDTANGGLSNFWQLGTNTIDMMDRFGASVTKDFQGGVGKSLSGVVQGGTQDLQQFGDVLGNIGDTALKVIPSLPGVGGDLLTTLNAATKGLSEGAGLLTDTGLMGPLLAFEAASRYGPTVVGAAGAGIGRLGSALTGTGLGGPVGAAGGFLGKSAVAATEDDVAAGRAVSVGDMIGGEGVAGALGGMTATTIGGVAALTYLESKLWTEKSPSQSYVGGITGPIGSAPVGYTGFSDITSGMKALQSTLPAALQAAGEATESLAPLTKGTRFAMGAQAAEHIVGTSGVSSAYQQGMSTLAGYMNDSFKAGQQVSKLFGVSLPEAFALTAQSGLQLNTAFGKDGLLNSTSLMQIENMKAGYQAMNQSSGVMAKSIGAVQATSGLAATQIGNVNSAWDTLTQNATSGEGSATGLAGSIAGMKSLGSTSTAAKDLTGFTSPASQAAWSAFSSNSTSNPGLIQQLTTLQDSLRLAQTSGVLKQSDVTGASMYQARQLLPYAKDSPAALANLSISAQAAGFGGFAPGASQAQDFKQLSEFVDKHSASAKQNTKILNKQAEGMSDVSSQAANFGATMNNDVYNAMAKSASIIPQATKNMGDFAKSLNTRGAGTFSGSALMSTVKDLAQLGAGTASIKTLMGQVLQEHGISGAAAQHIQMRVTADTAAAQAAINGIKGKDVKVNVMSSGAQAAQAAIDAMHGKTVTITEVLKVIGGLTVPAGGGPASGTLPGGPAGMRLTSSATGMRVPGYGGGDRFPALLEGGEAVVPKELTPAVAPFLAAHGVPGFASGGIAGSVPYLPTAQYDKLRAEWETYKKQMESQHKWYDSFSQWYQATQGKKSSSTGSGSPSSASGYFPAGSGKSMDWTLTGQQGQLPLPATIQKLIDSLDSEVSKSGIGKQFAVSVMGQFTSSIKNLPNETQKLASALMSKATTEINYAKNTASSTVSGLNLGGMDTTQQTVAQGMQSYLTSIQGFTADMKTLSKDKLSKGIMSQLIAAGPVQGDALAQSILQGGGTSGNGVAQVNKLFAEIGTAAKGLGARAAMSMYGGVVAPNLKSETVTNNNISVSISVPGGSGGNLNLTPAQIKTLTEEVQAKLLQQAKRNNKTGVAAKGKKA